MLSIDGVHQQLNPNLAENGSAAWCSPRCCSNCIFEEQKIRKLDVAFNENQRSGSETSSNAWQWSSCFMSQMSCSVWHKLCFCWSVIATISLCGNASTQIWIDLCSSSCCALVPWGLVIVFKKEGLNSVGLRRFLSIISYSSTFYLSGNM